VFASYLVDVVAYDLTPIPMVRDWSQLVVVA
jgi:hypothetical protein